MDDKLDEFNLKLALISLKSIKETDDSFKNTLLEFYLIFNIFECFFFKEPRYRDDSDKDENYLTVRQRCKAIQEYCTKNNYIPQISKNVPQRNEIIDVSKFQEHFCGVYIEDDDWTSRGRSLKKSESNPNGFDEQGLKYVHNFLIGHLNNQNTYEHAIQNALSICYCFRNNTFHGSKELNELMDYDEDFKIISAFMKNLMYFLEAHGSPKF